MNAKVKNVQKMLGGLGGSNEFQVTPDEVAKFQVQFNSLPGKI